MSTPLRLLYKPSQYFNVAYFGESYCTKIAPGMSYQCKITFKPEELKDYLHTLEFVTEEEAFKVPIIGMLYYYLKLSTYFVVHSF